MTKIFHHLFFLKKPKGYTDGEVPIYLRITISGQRSEISINKKVDPSQWLSGSGRVRGRNETARLFNLCLVAFEGRLYEAHLAMIRNNEIVTAASLKK